MRLIYILALLTLSLFVTAQENFNLERLGFVELSEAGNDIWGYVDGTGLEYAVMGSRNNTFIWSLEDPANPIQRAVIPGGESTWRDIKAWDEHLYVTNDQAPDGLLVINMTMAPDSITFNYITPEIPVGVDTTTLGQCHNLYIDENGFCYLSGCRINGANKAIILDLNQDREQPPIVGVHGGGGAEYAHDLFVENNIMYSSEINAGVLTLFDVTDKANIVELGDASTSMNFTHNTWASPDGQFAFTTDERANAYVDSYDVSDPGNIIRLDSYQPIETVNTGVVPHNTHYQDGYLITSWYTDGVVITDASRPDNMVKVGAFDTYPIAGSGFQGCWGAYPYLPSGLVLTSNITNANGVGELNVFRPNYVRAAFLEGTVTDVDSGATINGVQVIIGNPDRPNEELTDALGEYKTGIESAGFFDVTFSHPDYFPTTLITSIENGVVTILDAQLQIRPQVQIVGTVIDAATTQVIPNAQIKLTNDNREIEITTDGQGAFNQSFFDESYTVTVGAWGFQYEQIDNVTFNGGSRQFELNAGIEDNFALDLGWSVTGDAATGAWERGIPNPTFFQNFPANVNQDITTDIGLECYMTGNAGGQAGADDVDNGTTILTSPEFNVSQFDDPIIEYNAWFFIGGGNGPVNDTMFINIADKTNTFTIDMYTEFTNGWSEIIRIPLSGLVNTDDDLTFSVVIGDQPGTGHLLEGGLDVFRVVDGETSTAISITDSDNISIFPNPFRNNINIVLDPIEYKMISVYDITGRQVHKSKVVNNQTVITNIETPGYYTAIIERQDGTLLSQKLIKQ